MADPTQHLDDGLVSFIHRLRGTLPYLEEFHGETFVIKLSGMALQTRYLDGILDDLILLHRVGIRIVIIHGALPQIQTALAAQQMSLDSEVNTLEHFETMIQTIHQSVSYLSWSLLARLGRYGEDIFPFSGHFVQAQNVKIELNPLPSPIGQFKDLRLDALKPENGRRFLPVVSPVGLSADGHQWLLEPNEVAMELAVRLRARKLITLSHTQDPTWSINSLPNQITSQQLKQWLKENQAHPEQHAQLNALVEACERGVERCHLLECAKDGSLLGEVLTSVGAGVMVTNSSYQRIRSARLSDLHQIAETLKKPMREMLIVNRDYAYLERYIDHFLVFCIDEELVGCCEMIHYEAESYVEISSLAVKESHRNRGIGKRLIDEAVELSRQQKRKMVFALSIGTAPIFLRYGFKEVSWDLLPAHKRQNFDTSVSMVCAKKLF